MTRPRHETDDEIREQGVDAKAILNALADPVFTLDGRDRFVSLNDAAEQFFGTSASALVGQPLAITLPGDSLLFRLASQARDSQGSVSQYEVTLDLPKTGRKSVSIDVSPIPERPDFLVVVFQERSIARKLDNQLTHRNAARSVTAMAAMLAHEVKNPLSGIRGAAQLLEQGAGDADVALTRLICEEADRIVALVDRMEMFSDERPIARDPVNVHEVLEHVRKVAEAGFARAIRIVESYDPSLPPVLGNRDLLIQALLNLVKNAAEAAGAGGGEVVLSTHYQQGVRLAVPGSDTRVDLPLVVSVQDDGPGIPEDLQPHLFEPFVTTKNGGKGLGLALVAKIIGDHAGVIEFESRPQRTVFRIMLPKASETEGGT